MIDKKELPIGVFDSGMGGLTVLRVLQHRYPHEHFLYLGDTARLPYGTKSLETVCHYVLNANEILLQKGIKALVLACNTATAAALTTIRETFHSVAVMGVIEPGVQASLAVRSNAPIVVLATEGIVSKHAYKSAIAHWAPEREVIEWPCQLLVALAEEGWCEGPLVEEIVRQLLTPMFAQCAQPACIVLGCTHFPALKKAIQAVVQDIPVIDPAQMVAEALGNLLVHQEIVRSATSLGSTRFLATDGVARFARVAKQFLGRVLLPEEIELVSLATTSTSQFTMNHSLYSLAKN